MMTREELATKLLERAEQCLLVDVAEDTLPSKAHQDTWKTGRDLLKGEAEITEKWAQSSLTEKQISAALATAREFLGLNADSKPPSVASDPARRE